MFVTIFNKNTLEEVRNRKRFQCLHEDDTLRRDVLVLGAEINSIISERFSLNQINNNRSRCEVHSHVARFGFGLTRGDKFVATLYSKSSSDSSEDSMSGIMDFRPFNVFIFGD